MLLPTIIDARRNAIFIAQVGNALIFNGVHVHLRVSCIVLDLAGLSVSSDWNLTPVGIDQHGTGSEQLCYGAIIAFVP